MEMLLQRSWWGSCKDYIRQHTEGESRLLIHSKPSQTLALLPDGSPGVPLCMTASSFKQQKGTIQLSPLPTSEQWASPINATSYSSLSNISKSLDIHCHSPSSGTQHLLPCLQMCLLQPILHGGGAKVISLRNASDPIPPASKLSAELLWPQDKVKIPCLGLQGHDLPT